MNRKNQKLYETIMMKVSKIVKQKLNEDVFTNGSYDRWRTSGPDDDESLRPRIGIIKIDIPDILYNTHNLDETDPDFCERILDVLGLPLDDSKWNYDMLNVYVDGEGDITDSTEVNDILDQIDDPDDKSRLEDLVYDEIERCISDDIIEWEYDDEEDDLRDYYKEKYMDEDDWD